MMIMMHGYFVAVVEDAEDARAGVVLMTELWRLWTYLGRRLDAVTFFLPVPEGMP